MNSMQRNLAEQRPEPRSTPPVPDDESFPSATRDRRPRGGPGRLILFFALVVALAYGLDRTISFGLQRITTSKFGSLNRVFSGSVNADIIINGSSRALVHYDPRVIESATGLRSYNLGMNAIQVDVQLAILKAYLARNQKPKLVIQNLESFSFETTRRGEIYDPAAYIPYLGEPELYRALLKIDPAVWKWKHIPLYGYAVEDMAFTWVWALLGIAGYSGGENYFQGFNPRFMEWTEDFNRFKAGSSAGVTYRIEPEGVAALREIIATCRQHSIDLVLVYSPEYHEMQALEKNRPEIFAKFQELCREANIPLWDFSPSPLCLKAENFYNSQHLNARGAAQFSAEIAQRLRTHLNGSGSAPKRL